MRLDLAVEKFNRFFGVEPQACVERFNWGSDEPQSALDKAIITIVFLAGTAFGAAFSLWLCWGAPLPSAVI